MTVSPASRAVAQAGENGAMHPRGFLVDRATQAWVRATGQRVSLADHPWLDGPVGSPNVIGEEWLPREAERLRGQLSEGGGLLESLADLGGDAFDPSRLSPAIVDFYEHTTEWRLDAWSQWSPVALPAGWLLSAVFARRLQQLALPMRPLDVAHGMDSRVVSIRDAAGHQLGAAWLRTLRSTGRVMYSGWYGSVQLPHSRAPSIRVMFPLPNGSVTVFLRPSVDESGALILTSPISRFGDDGAYLIVRGDGDSCAVRRIPLAERFRVYVDDEGTLRTDHALSLWSIPTLRFHYRLERKPRETERSS
jgi:hypothetical protein